LFSLLGLAGFAVATRQLMAGVGEYALISVAALLLARAHYLATWREQDPRWSKAPVWASTALVVLLWWFRL
jgi:hypothetical protein